MGRQLLLLARSRTERLGVEEKQESTRRRTLQRELEWVHMSPRARQAKGKARLAAYEQLLADEMEAEKRVQASDLHIPPGPRLGDLVVEAQTLRKGYGENLLIDGLSFSSHRRDTVRPYGNRPSRRRAAHGRVVPAATQVDSEMIFVSLWTKRDNIHCSPFLAFGPAGCRRVAGAFSVGCGASSSGSFRSARRWRRSRVSGSNDDLPANAMRTASAAPAPMTARR